MKQDTFIAVKDGFTLRLAKKSDANTYYQQNFQKLDPEVVRITGCKDSFSKEEVVSFFLDSLQDNNRRFFLIESRDGRIIGECVLSEIDWIKKKAHFRIALFQAQSRG